MVTIKQVSDTVRSHTNRNFIKKPVSVHIFSKCSVPTRNIIIHYTIQEIQIEQLYGVN